MLRLMNILIENDETHEFMAGDGTWTKKLAAGKKFPASGAAVLFAKQLPIGKFTVVRVFSDSNQFVNLDHGRGKGSSDGQ